MRIECLCGTHPHRLYLWKLCKPRHACALKPELLKSRTLEIDYSRAPQRSNDWARVRFTHFRWLPVNFPFHQTKFPRSTSFTRAISALSPNILPLQKFFSRVLLLRQQVFSSGKLPPEKLTTATTAIKTQVFMFRYERVNSRRKFTIVVEIVSLSKKTYKRDAPFRAAFKVKTLAVLFLLIPAKWKQIPRNLNLLPFCRLLFSMEMATHSRAWLKQAHSFDRCGFQSSVSWYWPKDTWALGTRAKRKKVLNTHAIVCTCVERWDYLLSSSCFQSPRAFWSAPRHGALE